MSRLTRSSMFLGVQLPLLQWILWALCGLLAALIGFVVVDTEGAKWAIQKFGYWQMLLMTGLGVFFLLRHLNSLRPLARRWWKIKNSRRLAGAILIIVGASVFAHIHFPHRFKVLADEATLLNTSGAMHQHRLTFTPGTSQYRNGIFFWSEGYIDKRPYLFPFLVSVVHDLTGYRVTNPLWFNALLTPAIFTLYFLIGREINRRRGPGLAIFAGMGVPIAAHVMTGAGFETLNLLFLLSLIYLALRCVRRPTVNLISLLALNACLLAYCRYESALYVLPAGLVIWFALRRRGNCVLPALLYFAPFFLLPVPWLQRIAFANEDMYFQLVVRNDPSAFSSAFLARNLASAWDFFFVPNPVYLSSPLITVAGLIGVCSLTWAWLSREKKLQAAASRQRGILLMFVLATAANAVLFLFFNYGQYDAYITQRISVPVFAALVLGCVFPLSLIRWRVFAPICMILAGVNLLWFYLPAATSDYHFREYVDAKDFAFVQEFVRDTRGEEGMFVYTHNAPAWLCARVPCLSNKQANADLDGVLKVLRSREYGRILIHTYRYTRNVTTPEKDRHLPPPWFDKVDKKLIAERWVAQGITVAVYELIGSESNREMSAPLPKQ